MLRVTWHKPIGGWHSLDDIDLAEVAEAGVYIIWHEGNPGRVVRVGQGIVSDRIRVHRKDRAVTAYRPQGLRITWAPVPWDLRDGVERHLADKWKPLLGDAFPDVAPIVVNSPW
jgi:hypothetical protein